MRRLSFLLPLLLLTACRRDDDIQTYRASKDSAPAMPAMREGEGRTPPVIRSKEISWKVPEGWQEQAPSSMRVGSFLIKGKTAEQADVSVVPLSGSAGGDLANINRWRGQISLDPISEAELARQSRTITPAGREMLFVDFSNKGRRLMAAIYQRGARSWFFKMTGEDAVVGAAKPTYLEFLNSLSFHDHE